MALRVKEGQSRSNPLRAQESNYRFCAVTQAQRASREVAVHHLHAVRCFFFTVFLPDLMGSLT